MHIHQIEPEPTVPFDLQSKCPKIFAERKRFVVMLSAGISYFSSGFLEIPIIKISFPRKLRSDDECGIRMLWRKKGPLRNLFMAGKYSSYQKFSQWCPVSSLLSGTNSVERAYVNAGVVIIKFRPSSP